MLWSREVFSLGDKEEEEKRSIKKMKIMMKENKKKMTKIKKKNTGMKMAVKIEKKECRCWHPRKRTSGFPGHTPPR